MRIGELASKVGVPVETVRFYEAEGLLPKAERSSSNYRIYGPKHEKRLSFIRRCRTLAMPLSEIRALIEITESEHPQAALVHQMLRENIAQIEKQIAELKDLKAELIALEGSCHCHDADHENCLLIDNLRT